MSKAGSASRRYWLIALAVVLVLVLLAAGNVVRRVVEGEAEQRSDGPFYSLDTPVEPGAPGDIIRREPIASAPLGASATRVIYHSRDMAGRDIAVSGIVIEPDGPAPEGGRTIVSWAHPTTGSAAHCAPSLGLDPFLAIEGMHELLAEGYAIAATDYPGMGVAGESSYLLGVTESNSVLDAARAARNVLESDVSDRLVLWGHSQGGQAALFAAQRAEEYAPDLDLRGVSVAAPAADLNVLMTDNIGTRAGVTIAAYAIEAYERAYADRFAKDELAAILTPAGAEATPDLAALCLLTESKQIQAIADPLIGKYVTNDPATTEPWQTLLRENSAGGAPITVPVFVGQGLADTLVDPSATQEYVSTLCEAGTDVSFHEFPKIDHALAAYASVPELLLWLSDISAAQEPDSTCP